MKLEFSEMGFRCMYRVKEKSFKETNLAVHETDEPREGKRSFVNFAHEKPLENHSIELASRSPHQKPVKLTNLSKENETTSQ